MNESIYSKEEIQSRIQTLLQTPRIYWYPIISEEHGYANSTNGLWDLVQECITPQDLVIEVGCFSGVSSQVIALGCRELHCVDPYSWDAVQQAQQMFDSMLPNYPNIKKVKMTSVDAAKMYQDGSIDFVYLDADHSYESVLQDIDAWRSKVKKNGYIAGHDMNIEGVERAVKERFGNNYKTYSDTSWAVKL